MRTHVRRTGALLLRACAPAWRALLAFALPDSCLSCSAPLEASRTDLCLACENALGPAARRVQLPGEGVALCAYAFEGPVRSLIHALKYGGRTSIADRLGEALAELVAAEVAAADPPGRPDLVAPVPLHCVRARERGFNQSELLARALAPRLGVPLGRPLRKVRHTPPQAGLQRQERLAAQVGVFEADTNACEGRLVLLVDDVVTTGATMAAASRALTDAGAAGVSCVAVAATPAGESG